MTDETRKFVIEVIEALADKCTKMLHNPQRDMRSDMSHAEARGVREQCLTALHELEQL